MSSNKEAGEASNESKPYSAKVGEKKGKIIWKRRYGEDLFEDGGKSIVENRVLVMAVFACFPMACFSLLLMVEAH